MDEAIDFRKLYLEEKRRIRRKKKEEQRGKEETTSKVNGASSPQDDTCPPFADLSRYSPLAINPLCRQTDQVDTSGVYYKARFLENLDFQHELILWLRRLPVNHSAKKDDELQALGRWTLLPHAQRRVALFDARKKPIPAPLQVIIDQVTNLFHFGEQDETILSPNHILINEYEADQGIMPHTDGPAYAARTVTISLGQGSVLLKFTNTERHLFSVLLEGQGSLVLFENKAYSEFKHSIEEGCVVEHADMSCRNADDGAAVRRDYRISITIRHKY